MTEVEWLEVFGDNLYEMILESGYTQNELADKAGLSQAAISGYINNRKMPGIKAIVNLSYALDCRIDDLIDFGDMIE